MCCFMIMVLSCSDLLAVLTNNPVTLKTNVYFYTPFFQKGVYNYTSFQKRCVKLQILQDMNFNVCNYTHLSDDRFIHTFYF
jgi:hypothetical protein